MPDFIVIGAQKGGTTSLFYYLGNGYHPKLRTSKHSELNWFTQRFHSGVDKLLDEFPPGPDLIRGYKSPNYLPNPWVPARMRFVLPDVKLVLILREPASRARSAYAMAIPSREKRSFKDCVQAEISTISQCFAQTERVGLPRVACLWDKFYPGSLMSLSSSADGWKGMVGPAGSYLLPGLYSLQLRHWLKWFPLKQFHITTSKAFKADTAREMREIGRFVGLTDDELRRTNDGVLRQTYFASSSSSATRAELDPSTKSKLAAFFEPHNNDLWSILGRRLDW